jgi:type VI secretion system secreted protein VgrG
MAEFTQEKRPIAVETPLGKDALLLTSFSGHEEVSRLFRFQLEFLSEKSSISDKSIIGKNISFSVEFQDGSPRYFNGIVQRFAYAGTTDRLSLYRAEVVPWLWFLTRTADCRIFQNKSVPDIIKEVLGDAGFSAEAKFNLQGTHDSWEYCVQYRESDFDFISRLMEREGIFYYFTHAQGSHKMVLGDHKGAYQASPDSKVQFLSNLSQPEETDQIRAWEHQFEFRSGKWAQTDYNFETPSTSLLSTTNSTLGIPTADKFEVFEFPGEYATKKIGEAEVKLRMEEEEAGYNVVHGQSVCRGFGPGLKFTLEKHHNAGEQGKGYVVTSVRHRASVGATYTGGSATGDYRNSFTCIPDSVAFRPERTTEKPLIHGVQTAVVVGPAGEEIYCDKYGRVKVHFHWDRLGKKDDKDSCWIRCAQSIAGKNWGAMTIPRIGQEVVVTYLEGDPDRPLITGIVYNAAQTPAYELPGEKTKTVLKTNSSPGGDGFNELRFEDGSGKEQIFMHAQRNQDLRVLNDQMQSIGNDRHLTVAHDVREKIVRHKDVQIDGNVQETIKGKELRKIGEDQHEIVLGSRAEKISGDCDLTVGGDKNTKITGTDSLTTTKDLQQKVGMNLAVESGMAIHIKAGMSMVLEAGLQLSLKVGGCFIDLSPAGVAINGVPLTLINSGGAAGAGAGCTPNEPKPPEEPQPEEPVEADNAKTGQKSAP